MNVFNIKVKLENINKSYDLCLNDIETITDQLEKFLSSIKVEGEKKVLHLFNLNNGKFITHIDDIKSINKLNDVSFLFKNFTEEAKKIISSMMNVVPELKNNKQDSKLINEIKNIGFLLQNHLSVEIFLEEFISFEGIKILIEAIEITFGNSRSYLISSFNKILFYCNALEYIRENSVVVNNLYHILSYNDTINTIKHTLEGLFFICEFLKPDGIKLIYNAALEFSQIQQTKVFKELVQYINDTHIEIKVNALMLICCILQNSKYDKSLQAQILVHFQVQDINPTLEKNASDCLSNDFQIQLTNYQKITGEIIKGSNYEVIHYYNSRLKYIRRNIRI